MTSKTAGEARLEAQMALRSIGFTDGEAAAYLGLSGPDAEARRREMLEQKRAAVLAEVHRRERQLERLDCLRRLLAREAPGEDASGPAK